MDQASREFFILLTILSLTPSKVFYLLIVETVNTGCDMYIVYQPLIDRFGPSFIVFHRSLLTPPIGLPEATQYFPTREFSIAELRCR